MVDRQIFAARFSGLRTKKGLTQPLLAAELGMIKQRISNWENGTSLPSADVLHDLALYFNVTSDYLLGLSDNPDRR